MYALIDDFGAIETIDSAAAHISDMSVRFNYTGIPYYINNHPLEACDIIVDGNLFTFTLYANDCMAGCLLQESRYALVTENCEVLTTPSNSLEKMEVYLNPTSSTIYLKEISSEVASMQIYSVQGKLLKSYENVSSEIDISQLKPGIYFLRLVSTEGNSNTLKFIKK